MRVNHVNHGMYGLGNIVNLFDITSDIPTTTLSAAYDQDSTELLVWKMHLILQNLRVSLLVLQTQDTLRLSMKFLVTLVLLETLSLESPEMLILEQMT